MDIVELDASCGAVIDQVVGDGVGAGEGLGQYPGDVVVALVADDADVAQGQVDAGGVAKGPAVSEGAAV